MGFFDTIKQKTAQLSDFMQINVRLQRLEDFIYSVEKQLGSTVLISEASSDELETLDKIHAYLLKYPLNKNDKYREIYARYPSIASEIRRHNSKVEGILTAVSDFQCIYKKILENPDSHEDYSTAQYEKICREIRVGFSVITPNVAEFVSQYEDVKFNIEEIVWQYYSSATANSLMDITDDYIFRDEKESLISKLQGCLPKDGTKRFYQFPSVKQLVDKINKQNLCHCDEISGIVKPIYDDLIENPYSDSLDLKRVHVYDQIIADLQSEYTSESQKLISCYNGITVFVDEIRRQYKAYPKAHALLDVSAYGYISEQLSATIINNLKDLLPKSNVEQYYSFPTVEKIEKVIFTHNVDVLLLAAKEFNVLSENIMNNPVECKLSSIDKYSVMVVESAKYDKKCPVEIQNFIKQYGVISTNLDEIKRQYVNLAKIASLMDVEKYSFIDDKTKERIISQINVLMPTSGSTLFYKFPSVDSFRSEIARHNDLFFKTHPNTVYFPETNSLVTLTDEQLAIKNFLEQRNIRYLVHFTDSENVESIKKYGLLSVKQLMLKGIRFKRNDLGRYDNMPDYISLSVTNPNFKVLNSFIHRGTIDNVKVVYIDATILYKEIYTHRVYCDRNAANGTCVKGDSIYYLKNMFAEKLEYRTPTTGEPHSYDRANKRPCDTTDTQAEILFNKRVDPKYILDIK